MWCWCCQTLRDVAETAGGALMLDVEPLQEELDKVYQQLMALEVREGGPWGDR